eukprot:TRINITY_DN36593_c0_g1_i2.p4 TRINITY_DN36593_c0_g1~~TRINITY_DN36593_c0_g1_i2.p4  ORF type:complete len:146 (+),score=27.62 TRINITY_DN36593_c0_g1_i2:143-580(+)
MCIRDRYTASAFHQKCDGKSYTLTIIKSNLNKRFGGFTTLSWDSSDSVKKNDPYAFVYSIEHKQIYTIHNQSCVIECYKNQGPQFGHEFYIYDNCDTNKGTYSELGSEYGKEQGIVQGSEEANNKLAGSKNFTVKEIEVYQISLQ